jgi:2-C-methyl-D-erythritol 4-phosphate cytidylyltransferase
MSSAAIFLCAGRGTRMKAVADDKVLAKVAGKPVFLHSVEAFVESGLASTFVFVFRSIAQRRQIDRAVRGLKLPPTHRIIFVRGGVERQESVRNALEALPPATEWVLIHDAARPLVRAPLIRRFASLAKRHGSAVFAHRVVDTVKEFPEARDPAGPIAARSLERGRLWATETPQIFRRAEILEAYTSLPPSRRVTDDAQAMEFAGQPVFFYENPEPNPKLTTPRDLAYAEFLFAERLAKPRKRK